MDAKFKDGFTVRWRRYFNDAELPITLYYTMREGLPIRKETAGTNSSGSSLSRNIALPAKIKGL
jgi:hypothetical protein